MRVPAHALTDVVLIVCSDVHITAKCPPARLAESSWQKAMRRTFKQIQKLMDEHQAPLCVAGDLFDRWRSEPEAISIAVKWFPSCIAIPGNHDLPYHSYDEIKRSAFWTLVQAGKVKVLEPDEPWLLGPIRLHGFPCGFPVKKLEKPHSLAVEVAVVHDYIWDDGHGHTGAPESNRWGKFKDALQGYDLAVFGDNHSGFERVIKRGFDDDGASRTYVYNCGSTQRRKVDEKSYEPAVGLVRADGTVTRYYLDTSEDLFSDDDQARKQEASEGLLDVSGFMTELGKLGEVPIDFREAMSRVTSEKGFDSEVKQTINQAMGDGT